MKGGQTETQRYQSRVKMERERSYARLLGKPKSKLVSLKKKRKEREKEKKQSIWLRNEEEDVQKDIEDGREFQNSNS